MQNRTSYKSPRKKTKTLQVPEKKPYVYDEGGQEIGVGKKKVWLPHKSLQIQAQN